MTEAHNRRQASFQVLLATLWLTMVVLAIKVWAGWATHSLSLLAESLHTLIDGFSVVLSLVAVASPYRMAGREVWYHGRRETASLLVLVAFLGFAGLSLLTLSVQQLEAITHSQTPRSPVQVSLPLVQLLAVVVAINLCLALFEQYESRRLESTALRINASHMLRDGWLTLAMLAGLVGVWAGYIWLDPLLAIVLVLMAIKSCWRVLTWQLPLLVRQVAIAPEALAQIVCQVEGVTHCTKIRTRGVVGRQVFVDLTLVLHPEFLGVARLIGERVEGTIRERYGPVQVRIRLDGDRPDGEAGFDGFHLKNNTSPRHGELD